MADQRDTIGIDVLAASQIFDRRFAVVDEVAVSGRRFRHRAFAGAAIIMAQHGHAVGREFFSDQLVEAENAGMAVPIL